MAYTPRDLILVNALISSVVVTLQILFPYQFYDSPVARRISEWTGLPLVTLVDENSCAHSLIVALNLVVLVHLWMGATTSRKHAHASTALMQLIYSTIALFTCTPLVPRQYGSSISVIAAIPNLIFAFGICYLGNIGWKDMIGLFGGEESIKERDRVKVE